VECGKVGLGHFGLLTGTIILSDIFVSSAKYNLQGKESLKKGFMSKEIKKLKIIGVQCRNRTSGR
jgi:hypothetical protein